MTPTEYGNVFHELAVYLESVRSVVRQMMGVLEENESDENLAGINLEEYLANEETRHEIVRLLGGYVSDFA